MISAPRWTVNGGCAALRERSGTYAAAMNPAAVRRKVQPATTKDRLMRAGERLFARRGVDRVRLWEINELAGQRNSSALHYHFGSRDGLVLAILRQHEDEIDAVVEETLDRWDAQGRVPTVRDIAEAVVRPLAAKLESPSGRDFLRIVPHVVPELSATLRAGHAQPLTPQSRRLLDLYDGRIAGLPQEVRRERLVVYMLLLTTVLAERAQQLESRARPTLTHEQFVVHLLDVVEGIFTVPSRVQIPARSTLRGRS
jgi:AcrR family transcriptional regulator